MPFGNDSSGRLATNGALGRDFVRAKAVGGLGSTADFNLGRAVQCFLVGLDEPAERLLRFALEWVDVAIWSGVVAPGAIFSGWNGSIIFSDEGALQLASLERA